MATGVLLWSYLEGNVQKKADLLVRQFFCSNIVVTHILTRKQHVQGYKLQGLLLSSIVAERARACPLDGTRVSQVWTVHDARRPVEVRTVHSTRQALRTTRERRRGEQKKGGVERMRDCERMRQMRERKGGRARE